MFRRSRDQITIQKTHNPAYKLRKALPHLETEQTIGINPTAAAPGLDNSVHGLPLILESWRRRWAKIFSKALNVTAPWD